MDYGVIIPIAAFLVAIQVAAKTNTHLVFPASIAVVLPYVVGLVVNYIRTAGHNLPILPNLFSLASVLIFIVQFALSVFIFKKIHDEDDFVSTVSWAVGGVIVVVFAIPFIIGSLVRF